jgi:hypothetical protein
MPRAPERQPAKVAAIGLEHVEHDELSGSAAEHQVSRPRSAIVIRCDDLPVEHEARGIVGRLGRPRSARIVPVLETGEPNASLRLGRVRERGSYGRLVPGMHVAGHWGRAVCAVSVVR